MEGGKKLAPCRRAGGEKSLNTEKKVRMAFNKRGGVIRSSRANVQFGERTLWRGPTGTFAGKKEGGVLRHMSNSGVN